MASLPVPRPDNPKRAEQIATELESAILAGRWQLGDRIGNEAHLAAEYAVSRWTMREAIAILEQAGTVAARRGAGGGLFVTAPAADLIRNSLCAYLELSLTPFDAIAEVRLALTQASSRLALAKMGNAERIDLARLLQVVEKGGNAGIEAASRGRILIRVICGNPIIALFHAALSDVGLHSCWMSALDDAAFLTLIDGLTSATRKYLLAMIADDFSAAIAEESEALAITAELHRSSSVSGIARSAPNAFDRATAIYSSAHPAKKTERLAWAIRRRISDARLEPGAVIGSEESLMLEYGVGRPVLREAIRVLERLGAVEMRRGGASGLTVSRPAPSHVIALARDYFRRVPPAPAELAETVQVFARIRPGNPVTAMMLAILAD